MGFAISGVWSAVATPLDESLNLDRAKLDRQCRWLLDNGCDGIALLGTTGEANSFSVSERKAMLEGVIAGGVTPDQMAPGVGVAAIAETVELTKHALSLGVTRVVMLPPFYYKNVPDDGVFAAYARIIEGVADSRLKVVLYNIPHQSGVPLSLELVARLVAAYPETVIGIKDSSGKLETTVGYCGLGGDFAVLVGSESKGKQLGLTPRARILATALSGADPTIMLTGPMPAARKALAKAGMTIDQIDLFEVNEAFAAVPMRFMKEMGVPHEKVNVNGGAIAMGHPLGATGAMILNTLIDELHRRGLRYGMATLCVGGGMGIATIVERI